MIHTRTASGDAATARRNGETLRIHVAGTIPPAIALTLDSLLREHGDARRLVLDFSLVSALDAVGLRLLSIVLDRWAAAGRVIDIVGLSESLQRRLGWHPLALYLTELDPVA